VGFATALGAAGARVAVNYSSDREGAERVAQAITDKGGEAIAVGADVSHVADVARLFKEVDVAFGRLDVLVNNAGVFRFGAIAAITEESFHLHYDITFSGRFSPCRRRSRGSGPTAGASSTSALSSGSHPVAGALLYASTKGAIETLTRGLALRTGAAQDTRQRHRSWSHRNRRQCNGGGPLREVPAPCWLRRRRSAGSVASRISPRWRCSSRQTNQPGSPGGHSSRRRSRGAT